MTIKLLEAVRIAGTAYASGAVLTLADADEAALVHARKALLATETPVSAGQFLPAPVLRSPRTLLVGDSLNARNWLTTDGSEYSTVGYGWLNHANVLSGHKWPIAHNLAVTGYNTANVAAIMPSILEAARTCGWIIVSLGTNDIFADLLAPSAFLPRMRGILDALVGTGAMVVIKGETARTFVDATKVSYQHALNDWFQDYATGKNNCAFFDAAAAIVSPTSTQFAPTSGLLDGSVHYNNEGARRIGAAFNTRFGSLGVGTTRLICSASDAYGVDSGSYQIFANPLMSGANASPGSQFTNTGTGALPTGSLPDNVQVDHAVAGSGDCVCDSPARADGFGDDVRLVIGGVTPAAANDRWEIRNTSNMTTGVSPGDLIQLSGSVGVSSHTNLTGLTLLLQMQTDGGTINYAYALRHDTNNVAYNSAFPGGEYMTRPVRVPYGSSITALQWRLQARFGSSGGTATVTCGRISVRNLTRAGLAN